MNIGLTGCFRKVISGVYLGVGIDTRVWHKTLYIQGLNISLSRNNDMKNFIIAIQNNPALLSLSSFLWLRCLPLFYSSTLEIIGRICCLFYDCGRRPYLFDVIRTWHQSLGTSKRHLTLLLCCLFCRLWRFNTKLASSFQSKNISSHVRIFVAILGFLLIFPLLTLPRVIHESLGVVNRGISTNYD